jgi:site-specific DNA recombinase
MAAVGRHYLSCSAARRLGTCPNRRSMARPELEGLILDALRHNLMRPEYVAEFVRAFNEEINRRRHSDELEVDARRRELADVTRKLAGVVDAIAEGYRAAGLQAKLDDLAARETALKQHIVDAASPAPRLHPNLAELYRQKVAALHEALAEPATRDEALGVLRGLVERVVLQPLEKGFEVELIGEIAAMIDLGAQNKKAGSKEPAVPDAYRRSVKVVAGERNQRYLHGLVSRIPVFGRPLTVASEVQIH